MESPKTPTKNSDGLYEILRSLSARWNLRFSERDPNWSPSKSPNRVDEEVKRRIRFLYFRTNTEALEYALDYFNNTASSRVLSEWEFKPHAEVDVIPQRVHMKSSPATFIKRLEVSESAAEDLMNYLLQIISQVADRVKLSKDYKVFEKNFTLNPSQLLSRDYLDAPQSITRADDLSKTSSEHSPRVSDDQSPKKRLKFQEHKSISADNRDPGFDFRGMVSDRKSTVGGATSNRAYTEIGKKTMLAELACEASEYPPLDADPVNNLVPFSKLARHQNILNDSTIPPSRTESFSFNSFDSTTSMTSSITAPLTMASTVKTTPSTSFKDIDLSYVDPEMIEHSKGPPCNYSNAGNIFKWPNFSLDTIQNHPYTDPMEVEPHNHVNSLFTLNTVRGNNQRQKFKIPRRFDVDQFIGEKQPPLSLQYSRKEAKIPFRQLWEVTRVASFCKFPDDEFTHLLNTTIDDYNGLWSSLSSTAHKLNKSLPEKCSQKAWETAINGFKNVSLTGEFQFSGLKSSSLFELSLKPLKSEKSYRLSRKFGGDRFITVRLPYLESSPRHPQYEHSTVQKAIIKILAETSLEFLGRRWRAFFLKPENSIKKVRQEVKENNLQLFLFSLQTDDDSDELSKMINWLIPFKLNLEQRCLKFFTRLALGVSKTDPTLVFNSDQIVRTEDAHADEPRIRNLLLNMIVKERSQHKNLKSSNAVMNDGCARIAKSAAEEITRDLKLDSVPSVFQGRIGGAKGLWMIDACSERLDENIDQELLPGAQRDGTKWIEITESQLKFEQLYPDTSAIDPANTTFEVHNCSRRLTAGSLNFQLIPILAHQGVPQAEFELLIEKDIGAKMDGLKLAMDDGLALRKWCQDNQSFINSSVQDDETELQCGLPDSTANRIIWFVEHGFEPKKCRFLSDLTYRAASDYCNRLQSQLHFAVDKSTCAYMIADPLGVLEPDQVHFGFSTTENWNLAMLHDIDVLVARCPAHLPSDIQKVHAVFKLELMTYQDVIVFPSKGTCSLAHKLSGGDYDGDRAWVCWEPAIVSNFQNYDFIPEAPSPESYGIKIDSLLVRDIIHEPDFLNRFLSHTFDFNLRRSLLGKCSTYHESLCYSRTSISDNKAMAIANLLGLLVDGAKAGFKYSDSDWQDYLRKQGLPTLTRLPKPAYRHKEINQKTGHIIDQLVFGTAKSLCDKVLSELHHNLEQADKCDYDLISLWKTEKEIARNDQKLDHILTELRLGLKAISEYWTKNVPSPHEEGYLLSFKKPNNVTFIALVQTCREDFLNLEPACPVDTSPSLVYGRWKRECHDKGARSATYWNLLKASALYHDYYHRTNFPWYVAGLELGEIKATARGRGSYRIVSSNIHRAMKVDRKTFDRMQQSKTAPGLAEQAAAGADEDEDDDDDDYDEFGSWPWDE